MYAKRLPGCPTALLGFPRTGSNWLGVLAMLPVLRRSGVSASALFLSLLFLNIGAMSRHASSGVQVVGGSDVYDGRRRCWLGFGGGTAESGS